MKVLTLLLIVSTIELSIGQPTMTDLIEQSEVLRFRNVGPTRGGRVTAAAGVRSMPGTFYMGATGGGVWRTADFGTTWKNVSDGYFASPSIGDINVAPSDEKVIYAGTGSDGLRSNIIAGKGIYKSVDEGRTWKHVGLENVGQIGAVEIHPDNPDIVFVAAIGQPFQPNKERGVYRTRNGGTSWELVLSHSDTVGAVDLEFAPGNPDVIYAAMWRAERKPWTIISGGFQAGGIYKSVDGGDTWKKIQKGLPGGVIGKIDLAVSSQDPKIVYALVEAPPGEGGIYVSRDQGESFSHVANDNLRDLLDRPFYYCNIEANPKNANSIYAMAEDFMKSTDGGRTWKKIPAPHGDHHDMWIDPNDTLVFIEANDGGVNITFNGGKSWSTQHNQPTAELYQVNVDDQYPYWLYAGQQDNTAIAVPSLPPHNDPAGAMGHWLAVGGCETGPSVPKPGDPNIVYSNCKGRFTVYNKLTGQEKHYYVGAADMYGHNPRDLKYRFQRVAPVLVSPHNPKVIYHGSQYLHKTTDEGMNWTVVSPDLTAFNPKTQVISGSPVTRDITGEEFHSTIYAVAESPIKEGLIWVGANDGPVHVTANGGKEWVNVTPPDLGEGGRVNCVEPSPHRQDRAYVCVLRYQLGDWAPYLYKTENAGRSWKLLTSGKNGIPANLPVRVVREDPLREGLLYAGTESGLFISFDNGENWKAFQQNLPVTPVTDIRIHRNDLIISTMGRGFWILDNISTLARLPLMRAAAPFVFAPTDGYTYRYKGNDHTATPHYPAPGLIIDYYIPEGNTEKIALEIYDDRKKLIRAFHQKGDSSEFNANIKRSEHSKAMLENAAGLHRFRWDIRHAGPWDKLESKRFLNGPRVAPGQYTVRLQVGDQSYEQPFALRKDPRLHDISINDVRDQEGLSLRVREAIDTAKRLAHAIQQRLPKNSGSQEALRPYTKTDDALRQLELKLVTREGAYMTPMLIDQLLYLASMLDKAEQKPGADAYARFNELKKALDNIAATYQTTTIQDSAGTGD